jgi:hypothetical protein
MRRSELNSIKTGVCESSLTSHRYHVERFLREVIIPRLAPISREMCLNYISEKVLDLPKSY